MVIASKWVHRVPLIIAYLTFLLVLSLFLAPLSEPEGTVTNLDANANWMDHGDRWKDMDIFPRLVYTFGDFNCHQKMERSIIVNGNQMPVCSRDVSIFIGLMFGSILLTRAVAHDHPSLVFTSILPKRLRKGWIGKHPAILLTISFLLLLTPTALDGGIQALSSMDMMPFGIFYESTNPTRILTGFPMGIGLGLLLTTMMMSLLSRRDDGGDNLFFFLSK